MNASKDLQDLSKKTQKLTIPPTPAPSPEPINKSELELTELLITQPNSQDQNENRKSTSQDFSLSELTTSSNASKKDKFIPYPSHSTPTSITTPNQSPSPTGQSGIWTSRYKFVIISIFSTLFTLIILSLIIYLISDNKKIASTSENNANASNITLGGIGTISLDNKLVIDNTILTTKTINITEYSNSICSNITENITKLNNTIEQMPCYHTCIELKKSFHSNFTYKIIPSMKNINKEDICRKFIKFTYHFIPYKNLIKDNSTDKDCNFDQIDIANICINNNILEIIKDSINTQLNLNKLKNLVKTPLLSFYENSTIYNR